MKDLQTVLDALIALTEHACACNEATGEIWGDGVTAISLVKQMMQAEPVAIAEGSHLYWISGYQPEDEESDTYLFSAPVAPQAVPDPMTMMTDASIMQVAQGWREFDAPDGSGPVDSMVYGACRAALNKYRDLLLEAK